MSTKIRRVACSLIRTISQSPAMSSAYSSQKSRRPGPDKPPVSTKDKDLKQKVIQLKEIYPTWSDDG